MYSQLSRCLAKTHEGWGLEVLTIEDSRPMMTGMVWLLCNSRASALKTPNPRSSVDLTTIVKTHVASLGPLTVTVSNNSWA
jgi:hypothetical protein